MLYRMVLFFFLAFSAVTEAEDTSFNALYNEFLKTYWQPSVVIHGIQATVFNYEAMKRDAVKPGSLFVRIEKKLAAMDPRALGKKDKAKAFWINVYNFAAMRLVIDQYPVDSIRSMKISLLKYPWSKDAIVIGGQSYSLKQIEKDILLAQFMDPRIVFAVSCAALSCPDRTNGAFVGAQLDAQLDGMIRTFLQNPAKGMSLNRPAKMLTLSWIFKKDQAIFTGYPGGIIGFVAPYLSSNEGEWIRNNRVNIKYFEHDWGLNDLALANVR